MPLKEILSGLVNDVAGGIAAIIIANDGISIEEFLADSPFDVQTMAIEYVTVLRELRNTVEVLGVGNLEELALHTENLQALMRPVNEDLFAILVLTRDGNYGKGRYLLRKALPALQAALA